MVRIIPTNGPHNQLTSFMRLVAQSPRHLLLRLLPMHGPSSITNFLLVLFVPTKLLPHKNITFSRPSIIG